MTPQLPNPSSRWLAWLAALLLAACSDKPYEQQAGQWRYDDQTIEAPRAAGFRPLSGPFARDDQVGYCRGQAIDGSHGPSLEVLDMHHARDHQRAYHCDSHRKGQEYYTVKHTRIQVLAEADPARLRVMAPGYVRDDQRLYHQGQRVPVRHIDSFEVLTLGYQRDRETAYYDNRPIAGSDGASFQVMQAGYARDRQAVWFTHYRSPDPELQGRSQRVPGAVPEAFVVLPGSYGTDGRQAYHQGRVLTRDPAEVRSLQVLDRLYARTASAVFHDGQRIAGADAGSFVVLESLADGIDARDAHRGYRRGEPVAPQPSPPRPPAR